MLDVASQALEQGITATLNDLEQQLFKLAEQAKSNDQQARCFESLREIRRGRSDVTPRFLIRLEAALAAIDKDLQAPTFARMTRGQREEFSLVEEAEFEQSLALQEVASKAEIRNSQTLFALGQRFGVLAGSAAIEADELPVGPHRLCECLRAAAACLDVQLEHRVLLYRVFDRTCMAQLGALYDKLNETCIEHRVLPNLQLTHTRKRTDIQTEKIPAGRAPAQARPGEAPAAEPGRAPPGGGAHPAGGAHHGGAAQHGAGAGHAGAHPGGGMPGHVGGGMPGHGGGHGGHGMPGAGAPPMQTLHTGA
ncbi:MAG TPA: DUF1631 family protein, partial [Xanthomonadales bacterium]|nr:DUF1631 family protein [Xanthomonadales bacterium]